MSLLRRWWAIPVAVVIALLVSRYVIVEYSDRLQAEFDAKRQKWIASATKAGCKRTSYVGTRSIVYAVWTCPDGASYLEPAQ